MSHSSHSAAVRPHCRPYKQTCLTKAAPKDLSIMSLIYGEHSKRSDEWFETVSKVIDLVFDIWDIVLGMKPTNNQLRHKSMSRTG